MAGLLFGTGIAQASTIIYVRADAAAGGDGTTWVKAYSSLQTAISASSPTSANPVEIWVKTGSYKPTTGSDRTAAFVPKSYTTIRGGFAGGETDPASRPDPTTATAFTVLSGDIGAIQPDTILPTTDVNDLAGTNFDLTQAAAKDNSYNVLRIVNSTVSLDEVVVAGGYANNSSVSTGIVETVMIPNGGTGGGFQSDLNSGVMGAGAFVSASNVQFTHCWFVGNFSLGEGGGVALRGGAVDIENSTFVRNFSGYAGGGLFLQATAFVNFSQNEIYGNTSVFLGGGLAVQGDTDNATVKAYEGTALLGMAALTASDSTNFPGDAHPDPKIQYNQAFAISDSLGIAQSVGQAILEKKGVLAPSLTESPLAIYAESGAGDALGAVYGWVCIAEVSVDLAVQFALYLGADPNSTFIVGWTAFAAGFNAYATPLGLAETIAGYFESLDAPSFEERATDLRVADYKNNQNLDQPAQLSQNRFEDNYAKGFGGGVAVLRSNLLFQQTYFTANVADFGGGGAAAFVYNTVDFENSAFVRNTSYHGHSGFLGAYRTVNRLMNDTIVGNASGTSGGYAIGADAGADLWLCNDILWGNTNDDQGWVDNPTRLGGADLWATRYADLDASGRQAYNQAGDGRDRYTGRIDVQYSDLQSIGQKTFMPGTADFFDGGQAGIGSYADGLDIPDGDVNLGEGLRNNTANFSRDPLLYLDIFPQVGSPVINAGSPNAYFDYSVVENSFDIVPTRRLDSNIDVGAVESGGTLPSGLRFYVNAAVAASGDGTTWDKAFKTLPEVFALTLGKNTSIWVAAGTYYATNGTDRTASLHLPEGGSLIGSLPVGATSIDQSDPVGHLSILSGNIAAHGAAGPSNVLIRGEDFVSQVQFDPISSRLIRGFSITGASGTEAAVRLAVPATIQNCTFSSISGERALWIDDPANFAYYRSSQVSDTTFQNCTGGGIEYDASKLNLVRSTFSHNSAVAGAGVRQHPGYTSNATLYLERCIVAYNAATGGRGGGIESNAPNLQIVQSDIVYNTATPAAGDLSVNGGAGVWWDASDYDIYQGDWQTINSIFYGNRLTGTSVVVTREAEQYDYLNFLPNYSPTWEDRIFTGNDLEGLLALADSGGVGGNVDFDPFFVNAAQSNFALQNTSPLINAGSAITSGADSGTTINGTARDVGAFESTVTSTVPVVSVLLTTPKPTPNGRVYFLSITPPSGLSPPITYTWQVQRPNTGVWQNVVNDAITAGQSSATLTLTRPPKSWDGSRYRVIYGSGASQTYSMTATVSIQPSILYVKTVSGGLADGSSWANAMRLEDALSAGVAYTSIWMAGGTHVLRLADNDQGNPFNLPPGLRIYGGFAGTEINFGERPTSGVTSQISSDYGFQLLTITGTATWPDDSSPIPTIFDGVTFSPPVNSGAFVIVQAEGANTVFNNVTFPTVRSDVLIHNGTAAFTKSSFTNASFGAALTLTGGTVSISGSRFSSNSAGAVQASDTALTVADSVFTANQNGLAGAISTTGSGSLDLQRCQFFDNISGSTGGALSLQTTGTSRIANSVFGRNRANASGGAIYGRNGAVSVYYSTLVANTGTYGAAVDAAGAVQFIDSIAWYNTATSAGSNGAVMNGGYTLTNSTVQGLVGPSPLFDPQSSIYALNNNSPLLNTGDTDSVQSGTTDVSGKPRHYAGGAADQGASEYQGAPSTPVYLSTETSNLSQFAESTATFSVAGNVGSPMGAGSFDWQYWNGSAWVEASTLGGATVTNGTNSSVLTLTGITVALNGLQFQVVANGGGVVSYATLAVTPRKVILVAGKGTNISAYPYPNWTGYVTSVDQAIFQADANTDIWIAGGNYQNDFTFTLPAGAHVYVGFAGNELTVDQRDPALHPVYDQFGGSEVEVVPTSDKRIPSLPALPLFFQWPANTTKLVGQAVSFLAGTQPSGGNAPLVWQYYDGKYWQPISNLTGWTVTPASQVGGSVGIFSTLAKANLQLSDNNLVVRAVYPEDSELTLPVRLTVNPRPVLYVNGAVSAPGAGTSWATAFKTIGEAIAAATSVTDIWIAGGDYPLSGITPALGTQFYVGFTGTETNVAGRNAGAHPVRLIGPASYLTVLPDATGALGTFVPQIAAAPSSQSLYVAKLTTFMARSTGPSVPTLAWEYYNGSAWVSISGLSGWSVTQTGTVSTLLNTAVPQAQNGLQVRATVPGANEVSFTANLTVKPRITLYVNGGVAQSGNGLTWATAFQTLAEAVSHADTGTDIWIVGGTYGLQSLPLAQGAVLYGGFVGTETALTDRVGSAAPVLLQGFGSTVSLDAVVASGLHYDLVGPPRGSAMYIGQAGSISISRAGTSTATLAWQYFDGSAWQPITGLAGWTVQPMSGSISSVVNSAIPQSQNGTQIRATVVGTSEISNVITLSVGSRTTLYVDGSVGSSGNGTSWGAAYKTVGEAVAHAGSGTDIWIAQGTYTEPTQTVPAGVRIYGGFASGATHLTDSNPGTHPTVLSSSGGNRVMTIDLTSSGSNSVTVIEDVSITGASSTQPAVYTIGGAVLFSGVTFSGNTCAISTGGAAAVLAVDGSTFTANATGLLIAAGPSVAVTATTFTGGAAAIQSVAGVSLLISGSTFTSQTGTAVQAPAGVGVESSTFSGAPQALSIIGSGALVSEILNTSFATHSVYAVQSASPVAITNGTFTGSLLGLDLTDGATASTITNSHFTGNTDGVHSPAGLTVTETVFGSNAKGLVLRASGATTTINGGTFSNQTISGLESADAIIVRLDPAASSNGNPVFSGNATGILLTGAAAASSVTGTNFTQNTTALAAPTGLTITGNTFATDVTGIALSGGSLLTSIGHNSFSGETGTAITSATLLALDTNTFTNCATAVSTVAGVTMTSCSVSGGANGLVIAAASLPATSTISLSTFTGVTAIGINSVDTLALTGDTFTGCALGVQVAGGGLSTVTNSNFQNGVAGLSVAYPAGLTLTGGTFSGNAGTAVTVTQQASGGRDTSVTGTQFLNNLGLLFTQSRRAFTFNRVTIVGNTVASGPLVAGSNATATFYNALFAHNTTTNASLVNLATDPAAMQIAGCTFADNATGSATGVVAGQNMAVIVQSILWGNRSTVNTSLETMQMPLTSATITQSVIEGLSSSFRTLPSQQDSGADPLFVSAPTNNYALSAVSGAIDAGGASTTAGTLDLAGNARIQSTAMDLGALESAYTASAQPLNLTLKVASPTLVQGDTATLSVTASLSAGETLRWQVNTGAGWTNLTSNSLESISSSGSVYSLALSGDYSIAGRSYRAVIALNGTDIYSTAAALLSVNAPATYYVNAAATGANNGTSWTDAYTSLAAALTAAPTFSTINVAAGTYTAASGGKFALSNNQHLVGSFTAGTATRDPVNTPTLLVSAGPAGTSVIMASDSTKGAVAAGTSVDGFTFQTGGIGLQLASASVTVRNSRFSGLTTAIKGNAHLIVDSSSFTGQTASAIALNGGAATSLQVTNSSFVNNRTSDTQLGGGAIMLGDNSGGAAQTAVVTNSTFTGNSAPSGGAIALNDFSSIATITGCTFIGNSATVDRGGAIRLLSSSTLTVRDSLLARNTAVRFGSAIQTDGSAALYYSTVTANSLSTGSSSTGAVEASSALTLHDSILWGNVSGALTSEMAQFDCSGTKDYAATIVQGLEAAPGMLLMPFDPRFVDAANGDYRLAADSPALGLGRTADLVANETDVLGTARPAAAAPALGAYESAANRSAAPTLTLSPLATLAPAYAGTTLTLEAPVPVGDSGIWQYYNGTTWVAFSAANGNQTTNSIPGVGSTDVAYNFVSGAFSRSNITLHGVLPTFSSTQLRFVLSDGTTTYVSTVAPATILPFVPLYVDASRSASGDGKSWGGAYKTIAEALTAADTSHRVIYVAEGVYRESITIPMNLTVYGGFPAGGSDLASRSASGHPTVLEGLAVDGVTRSNPVVHFTFSSTGYVQSALDGVVVENGATGLLVDSSASPGLSNLIVRGNNATGLAMTASFAAIQDCLFENNVGVNGGAISTTGGAATLDRVTVRGNTATQGGGLYLGDATVLHDVLVTGNVADTGGAIYTLAAPVLTQVTIAGNRARLAPAVYSNAHAASLNNSIVWGNRATQGTANVQFGIGSGGSFNFASVDAEQAPTMTGVSTYNPLFVFAVDAANAPTTTGDYRLSVVSPAIDTGSNALAAGLILDVAGQNRFVGNVDLGAYESATTGVTALTVSSPANFLFRPAGTNTFTVNATGAASIVWQYAAPNGDAWVSLDGVAGFSGALTNTLTITTATVALNGYSFRAVVTGFDGTTLTSGAATLAVYSAQLYVNSGRSGTDAGDGLTWATAFRSLDTALAAAPPDPAGTQIWIAAGNYSPATSFAVRAGLMLYGGFAGNESTLAARSPAANITALVGGVSQPNVILTSTLSGVTVPIRLDGLTIRDGGGNGVNNTAGCDVDIGGVKFTGLATALFNQNSGGAITLRHSEIRGNTATGTNSILSILTGSVLIENCLFAGNNAGNAELVYFGSGVVSVIRQSTFAGNSSHGGTMVYYDNSNNQLLNSLFWGNSGTSVFGGGRPYIVQGNDFSDLSFVQTLSPVSFVGNFSADPKFPAPIAATSAPFTGGTFTLGAGSAAIDAALNAQITSDGLDLAGNPRLAGLVVDPGAYEYQGTDTYSITSQPASVAYSATQSVSFTVGVSRPASYTWQVSLDGVNFTAIPGATNATLVVPAGSGLPGYSYKAVVQFNTGPQVTSNPASITALTVAATAGRSGGYATAAQFSATANSAVSTWQWQVSSGGGFGNVSGGTSSTLQVMGDPSFAANTYRVQATFGDGTVMTSNNVAFTYSDAVPTSTSMSGLGFTLTGGILASSLTDSTFTVLPQFGGRLSITSGSLIPSVSGDTATFTTASPIAAGSRVFVTSTSGLLRSDGVSARPQVWQYRVPTVSGPGAFAAPVALSQNAATAMAAGDVDGDGKIDLLVADTAGLRVWRNQGNDSFLAGASGFAPAGAQAIALGSLRSGSALDAVVVTAAGDVQIWSNNGTGTFTLAQTIASISARAVALGDLNADGDLDLFVATASGNRVYFNNGSGAFTLGSSFDSVAGTSVALGDLDNDGALDAVVTSASGTTVWANGGSGTFTAAFSTGGSTSRVALADLDNDGLLDVVVTAANQPASTWHNTGDFTFTVIQTSNPPGGGAAATLAAGDVDGDGLVDLILSGTNGSTGPWLTATSPLLSTTLTSTVVATQPVMHFGSDASLADLNGDGALDLIGIDANGHAAVSLYRIVATTLGENAMTALSAAGFTPAPAQVFIVALPTNGALLNGGTPVQVGDSFPLASAAALTYRPTTNFAGVDSFTWSATNGGAAHTYGILTQQVFTAPVATADALTVGQGGTATTLTGGGTNLLTNDINADPGTSLVASLVAAPAHGTVTVNGNGTFSYVQDNTAFSTDSFSYRATNMTSGLSAVATVSIGITQALPTAIVLTPTSGIHYTGQAAGLAVATLSGTDADPVNAGLLTFTLVAGTGSDGNSDFTISGTSLLTADSIDATVGLTRSIRVRATDPQGVTLDQTFTVTFTRAPTALAGTLSTAENVGSAATLTGSGGATALTYTVVSSPAHGTLTGTAPNLTYTPASNYSGADGFTFNVLDGTLTSAAATVAITVLPVNATPTLATIANPAAIFENASEQSVTLTGIGAGGIDVQTLTVTATSSNLALIPNPTITYSSPAATGTLTYTPVANATGTAVITVTVQDNGGTANGGHDSVTRTFTVTVNPPANVSPTLDAITSPLAIAENSGAHTVNLTGISAGGSDVQTLTVTASSDTPSLIPNPTVTYTSPNAIGSLSLTPVTNAIGTAVITVTVHDSGGTANGGVDTFTRSFTVTVAKANVAPTINAVANQAAIPEDPNSQQGLVVSGFGPGAGDTGQTYTVAVTTSDPGKFMPSVQLLGPAGMPTGALLRWYGTAAGTFTVTITLHDNGGTANGGVDTFSQSFTVTFTPVDDPNVPHLAIVPRAGSGVTLQLSQGTQNASYGLSYSTDLLNWTPLTSVITDNTGVASVDDATTPNEGTARFYRAVRN